MDIVIRRNRIRKIIWFALLIAWGAFLLVAVNADSYFSRYYNVQAVMLGEIVQLCFTLLTVWLWWYCATSESVKAQGIRKWISEHGCLATLLSFFPVWMAAAVAQILCLTTFTLGTTAYGFYSLCTIPFLYMALAYFLPPIEISQTILPGGTIVQKFVRGVLVAALLASIAAVVMNDFG